MSWQSWNFAWRGTTALPRSESKETAQAEVGSLLEEFCGGRTAFAVRSGGGHASAGLGLCNDGGMAYDLGKDEGCSMKRKITVQGRSDDRGKCRALLRDGRETCSGAG